MTAAFNCPSGVGYWVQSPDALSSMLQTLAKTVYAKRKNPNDCMLYYLVCDGMLHSLPCALFQAIGCWPDPVAFFA